MGTCAGSKCPHPRMDAQGTSLDLGASSTGLATQLMSLDLATSSSPVDAVKQLICIEEKCPLKVPKVLLDQDSKDLLTCAGKTDFSTVWDCLGDTQCKNSLSC